MNDDRLLHGVGDHEHDAAVVDAAALLEAPYSEPEFAIEHLVPRGAITLLTSDTGAGKTALLLHLAVAVAIGERVAGRFAVAPDLGPTLYLNGEMPAPILTQYLQQAVAGFGRGLPSGRFFFEGSTGVATFQFTDEGRAQLEQLVAQIKPSIIVLDTQRSLFDVDENLAGDVRRIFGYIRRLCEPIGASAIVAHHLRKIGQVSNSDRERVSGSRDIIASVDVHLAIRSRDGRPLNAIAIGKTRTPFNGVAAGTEWSIDARLEQGTPPRSIILAGEQTSAEIRASIIESTEDELRALLEAEGPLTLAQLGAENGNKKRAYEGLRKTGEIIEVGKDGRKTVYGLAGIHESDQPTRSAFDRTPDRTREKPLFDEQRNAVNARPRSSRGGLASEDCGRALLARPQSEPSSAVGGQLYIDRDRDRTRQQDDVEVLP